MTNETVWKTLSAIDVSDKTEKKGNLSYLSWAWAWGKLMENFPQATYVFTEWEYPDGTFKDVLVYDDGTCSVECEIRIEELSRKMWLPVMDYRNNAIPNPSSRQISDTKMRCLVKCLAMFGLGHYIYAGEDLPQAEDKPPVANEKAPTSKPKRKLSKAQQQQIDKIREVVTKHVVFTNNNGGTDMQKQVLQVIDGDPTPSQINEWHAYVVGEASLHDSKQSDAEHYSKTKGR